MDLINNLLKISLVIVMFLPKLSAQRPPVDFRHGKLANGLTYYIKKTTDAQVFLQLVVKVGYANEEQDQQGLAHLLEHVIAMNGTSSFPGGLNGFIIKSGGKVSGRASTNLLSTNYYFDIPCKDPKLFSETLQFLREAAWDSLINEKLKDSNVVNNERLTVLQEYSMHDDFSKQMKVFKMLGAQSGNRLYDPAITSLQHNEHIKTFRIESLQRLYSMWYRPEFQAIVIAGDIGVAETENTIKEYFGSIELTPVEPDNAENNYQNDCLVYLNGKNQIINLIDKDANTTMVEYILKKNVNNIPGVILTDLQIKNALYGELYNKMMESRFGALTQQYNSPFESIISYKDPVNPPEARIEAIKSTFILPQGASLKSGISKMLTELQRVARYGFSQNELDSAKKQVHNEYVKKIATGNYFKNAATSHFIYNSDSPYIHVTEQEAEKILKSITTEEINRFYKEWLSGSSNRDIAVTRVTGSDSLTENEFNTLALNVKKENFAPYKKPSPLLSVFDNKLTKTLRSDVKFTQSKIDSIEATLLKLDNGVKLLLKPLPGDQNSNRIRIYGFSKNSVYTFNRSDQLIATQLGNITEHSGVYKFDKFELDNFKINHDLQHYFSSSPNFSSVQASGSSGELEHLLQLIYLQFLYPNKNKAAFDDWVNKKKLEIKNSSNNEIMALFDTIKKIEGLEAELQLSDLKKISFDRYYEIFRQLFSNTAEFTFIISGSFDFEKISPLLLKYFGSLPSKKSSLAPLLAKEIKSIPEGNRSINFYTRNTDKSLPSVVSYIGKYPDDQVNKIKLDILGKLLNFIVFSRLTKEGVYYCGAGASGSDGIYRVNIQFTSEIKQVEKRLNAIQQEINMLVTNGPDKALFDSVITAYKENYQKSLLSPDFWCQYLQTQYLSGAAIAEVNNTISILDQLSTAGLQEFAKKLLVNENRFQFVFTDKY